MTAPQFDPHWVQRPGTTVERVRRVAMIQHALQALAANPDARLVAGGTDLVVDLARSSGPAVELIDISAIADFRSISVDEATNEFVLAGGVTHADVLGDARLAATALPLTQACLEIGSPQLRNRATLAGNLATASPANDSISALMALGASVVLSRIDGETVADRVVPVDDFFTGFRATALQPGEMITSIRVPQLSANERGVWVKLGLRSAQAISVVHAGFRITFDPAQPDLVVNARIALGSVASTVVLSPQAAAALIGQPLDDAQIALAATAAREGVAPIDDGRATADYRSEAVETVVARALGAVARNQQAATWPTRIPRLGQSAPPTPIERSITDGDPIAVTINDQPMTAAGSASLTLLDWLREHTGTGTKEGCAEGECGACTVQLDGAAVMSCLVPAAQADGSTITTIEGLAADNALSTMQQSFVDNFAVQCGYCIPGFVMAASTLADELDAPTRPEVEHALSGNLCRCTGYYSILAAVESAVTVRGASS